MSNPKMHEHMVEVEKKIATKIVEDALSLGYMITVNNGGEENEIFLSNDKEAILENMFASDKDTLTFQHPGVQGFAGFVQLIYGNGFDVILDYTVNPMMAGILKGAEELTQELEKA